MKDILPTPIDKLLCSYNTLRHLVKDECYKLGANTYGTLLNEIEFLGSAIDEADNLIRSKPQEQEIYKYTCSVFYKKTNNIVELAKGYKYDRVKAVDTVSEMFNDQVGRMEAIFTDLQFSNQYDKCVCENDFVRIYSNVEQIIIDNE